MLAWGLIGYLAGLFCRQLYQNKWLLYGYGAMSGIIFSMIMDLWSVLAKQWRDCRIPSLTVYGMQSCRKTEKLEKSGRCGKRYSGLLCV